MDNHIRDILDAVPPQQLVPMFGRIFTALYERGTCKLCELLMGSY